MLSAVEEEALLASARAGGRAALDTLLRAVVDKVHAVCRRLAGNDADADDATQEALLAIVKGLPRFDGASRFSTWAYRVATNACLDELRRRARRPAPALPDLDAASGAMNPADTATDRTDIDRALRALPEGFRQAVVLRDLCGLDYGEIAELLDIAPGTVRSRIARGRASLVPLLAPGNQPLPPERPTGRP